LPSTSDHLGVFVVALFLVGAIVFVIGTILRRESPAPVAGPEARLAVPEPAQEAEPSLEVRVDRVERLAIVGEPWCVEELEAILRNDSDEVVRDAADAALLVIAARPPA
jgi:biopolymer transport protein ExbD